MITLWLRCQSSTFNVQRSSFNTFCGVCKKNITPWALEHMAFGVCEMLAALDWQPKRIFRTAVKVLWGKGAPKEGPRRALWGGVSNKNWSCRFVMWFRVAYETRFKAASSLMNREHVDLLREHVTEPYFIWSTTSSSFLDKVGFVLG